MCEIKTSTLIVAFPFPPSLYFLYIDLEPNGQRGGIFTENYVGTIEIQSENSLPSDPPPKGVNKKWYGML